MVASTLPLIKAQRAIAATTLAASSYLFVAYRAYDQRNLSSEEVENACASIARISASLSSIPSQSTTNNEHMFNLTKYGATIVKKTLSSSQIVDWNTVVKGELNLEHRNNGSIVWQSGRAHYHVSKNCAHYRKMAQVGCTNCKERKKEANEMNSYWGVDLWWRRNGSKQTTPCSTDSDETEPSIDQIYLQDIVKSYFQHHGIQRYTLTDVQFLNAYPQSTNQVWHQDNTFRGLTAIVALCNIRDNGPTELILGSHQSNHSLWSKWWNCITRYTDDSIVEKRGPILLGCIDAGDTLLYDARIFHRGRGYDSDTNHDNEQILDRPVLVLRWDAAKTPPPGAGIIVTSINSLFGSMIYASLFVLRAITTRHY